MATAIKVENLSKIYRLGEIGTGTISRDIERFVKTKILKQEDPFLKIGEANDRATKGASDIVYSLKDINFEIEQGDAVGIIGRNGAGKSTLLKILSRVTTPTTGRINIKGRVASLLEVGTGFHPELTGRENIYLNGAILGMRKREIDRKLDEIIDFSGVERYIDTPVKRYSSGMYVRLAFAVAAHLESEILIVDEVLAVGDAEFQKKCLGKMGEVSKGEGRTVLFVSHNTGAVQSLCNTSIVMDQGIINFRGNVNKGVECYLSRGINHTLNAKIKDNTKVTKDYLKIERILLNSIETTEIKIKEGWDRIDLRIEGYLAQEAKMALEVRIRDNYEKIIGFFSPGHLYGEIKKYPIGIFCIEESIAIPDNITEGEFYVDIFLSYPGIEGLMEGYSCCKLVTEGVMTKIGVRFQYDTNGLLILKRY
jgi:lipopolysaccharide transport system ATP-binding protein